MHVALAVRSGNLRTAHREMLPAVQAEGHGGDALSKPIEAIYLAFGVRIRMIRETLGLSQAELAKRVGLERTSVVNIEGGRQRVLVDDIEKFARALGVTPKHLLKGIWW